MAKIRVEPTNDGQGGGGMFQEPTGGWTVTGRGSSSTHGTKRAANNEARRRAKDGDRIAIYRSDGTFQETITVGNGGASASAFGVDLF